MCHVLENLCEIFNEIIKAGFPAGRQKSREFCSASGAREKGNLPSQDLKTLAQCYNSWNW